MTTMNMPNLFAKSQANFDPTMDPCFGDAAEFADLAGKQMPTQEDPYPLMYLDNHSHPATGMHLGDLDGCQGQYMGPTLEGPRVAVSRSRVQSRPRSRPVPMLTRSSGGATDSSMSTSRSRTKCTRSKSGSVSGDNLAPISAEENQPKKRERRRKGTKASEEDEEKDVKRDSVLARNRVAALKCRKKKKEFVSDLEEQRIELEQKHQKLQAEYTTLLSEVTSMKNHLMHHATCNDPHIDNWLDLEARRFVQTTKERYSRTYGNADGLTYEELIETAAPVASALAGPNMASEGSTQRSSVCGSVVSISSRRSSIAHPQGGVIPTAYAMHSTPPTAWANPSELTMYSATLVEKSPTMPYFDFSLAADMDGV